jgi:hypothetical protein
MLTSQILLRQSHDESGLCEAKTINSVIKSIVNVTGVRVVEEGAFVLSI